MKHNWIYLYKGKSSVLTYTTFSHSSSVHISNRLYTLIFYDSLELTFMSAKIVGYELIIVSVLLTIVNLSAEKTRLSTTVLETITTVFTVFFHYILLLYYLWKKQHANIISFVFSLLDCFAGGNNHIILLASLNIHNTYCTSRFAHYVTFVV